jgi:hypothetical protein
METNLDHIPGGLGTVGVVLVAVLAYLLRGSAVLTALRKHQAERGIISTLEATIAELRAEQRKTAAHHTAQLDAMAQRHEQAMSKVQAERDLAIAALHDTQEWKWRHRHEIKDTNMGGLE